MRPALSLDTSPSYVTQRVSVALGYPRPSQLLAKLQPVSPLVLESSDMVDSIYVFSDLKN